MRWRWTNRPPARDPSDPDFRHGLLMRDVVELRQRVEALERARVQSMRPAAVTTAGLSSAVAGTVVGLLELLRYLGIFR